MSGQKPFGFRLCKYCGTRIGARAVDRWGKPTPKGLYCGPDCADAVHGFDNRIVKERARITTTFNLARHDRICPNTLSPLQEMIEAESQQEKYDKNQRAMSAMETARNIDRRLPDILMGIANGETQERLAKRWGITPSLLSQLIKKLRASV